jgi:predicted membrane-bound dolichyl-phosphate-mannose-protein mannosyltransferase
MKSFSLQKLLLPIFGFLIIFFGIITIYTPNHLAKISETYSPKELGNMYDKSQYTIPNSKKPISDALLYAYSGYEYVKGDNPLRLNAEHLTTGKYLIGLFYFLTGFIKSSGVFFVLSIFLAVNFLLYKKTASLLAVFIFSFFFVFDTNIRYQITGAPLLDVIQLFFWLVHAFCFYNMTKAKNRILWIFLSGISLGLMASSKMYIPALLTIFSDTLYIVLNQKRRDINNIGTQYFSFLL